MKRVRDKRLVSIGLILTFLTFAIASTYASTPPPDHVRIYIWNPATASNIYPAQNPGPVTYVQVWIDAPAAWYDTPSGIVGVTATMQVDPSVVEVLAAQAFPDMDFGGFPDSFLGDFLEDAHTWDGYTTFFTPGTVNKPTGTITATADVILGFTTLGLGAGAGPKPLWRWIIRTWTGLSLPLYSPITITDAYYTTVDGLKHPIHIVDHGHYGTPPPQFYMNYVGSLLPPGDPTGSTWHELYPKFCQMWTLDGWIDNGDGDLTASDQITMTNETGWVYEFHVDVVTVTIHYSFKTGPTYPDDLTGEEGAAELPVLTEPPEDPFLYPIGSAWHQVYPDYSREFVITSWVDNGDGIFSASDQFDFEYFGEGIVHWAHLDDVTTDIILSQKGEPTPPIPEFPLGLGLMIAIAPAIPIVYLWRSRKKGGIA